MSSNGLSVVSTALRRGNVSVCCVSLPELSPETVSNIASACVPTSPF